MDTRQDTRSVPLESGTRPGLVHRVDLAAGSCSCEATVEMCRHRRIALIRRHKILRRMEAAYRNELMDEDERLELRDTILRLRRSLSGEGGRQVAPSSVAMLRAAGYGDADVAAFGRALDLVRAGQDEDGAAEAEGVETGDFYALLDNEDAQRVQGLQAGVPCTNAIAGESHHGGRRPDSRNDS